ncbi:MAG: hypothetical protein HRU04_23765 [Oceanospirillaceae bacterium]|nr:hypothetical protein [Oceanospirillaceae bacterium]
MRISRQIKSTILAVFLKIGAGLLGYIVFILVARIYSSEDYGSFTVLYSVLMILGLFSNFGQNSFFIRQIELARLNLQFPVSYVYSFTLIATAFGVILGSSIWSLYLFITNQFNFKLILVGIVFVCLFGMSQTLMSILRSHYETNKAIFYRDFIWRTLIVILLYFVLFSSLEESYESILIIFSSTLLIPVLLMINTLRKINEVQLVSFTNKSAWDREWIMSSFGMTIIAVVSAADGYVFNILTAVFMTNTDAGAVFSSVKTIEIISIFMMAVSLIFSKDFSKCLAQSNTKMLQRKCNTAILLQAIPVLGCGIFVFIFGRYILLLFGAEYIKYASLLNIMCIGMLFNTLTGSTGSLMQLGKLHWQQVYLQTIALLIGCASMPLFILYFETGIIGVGYSYLIYKICWNVPAVIFIRSYLGVDPSIISVLTNYNKCNRYIITDFNGGSTSK